MSCRVIKSDQTFRTLLLAICGDSYVLTFSLRNLVTAIHKEMVGAAYMV